MPLEVKDAKALSLDLVHKAEGGEDIIPTRAGQAIDRIVCTAPYADERRRALEEARGTATSRQGTDAARSQDFLYDDTGLPV